MRKIWIAAMAACLLWGCSSAEKKADSAPATDKAAALSDAELARLLHPDELRETAPDVCNVKFRTTKGDIVIELHRDWSPLGVDRFYNLVKAGFFRDIAFFRMVRGFVVQFGIHGLPLVSDVWQDASIADDPVTQSNVRGTVTFATAGPNTRTTQLFINLGNNARLDGMGFSPIGKIVSGMDVVDALNFEYAERPNQGQIQSKGNAYLRSSFPNLDYILDATVE